MSRVIDFSLKHGTVIRVLLVPFEDPDVSDRYNPDGIIHKEAIIVACGVADNEEMGHVIRADGLPLTRPEGHGVGDFGPGLVPPGVQEDRYLVRFS